MNTSNQNSPPLYVVANTFSGPNRQQTQQVEQALLEAARAFEMVPLQQPDQLAEAAKKAAELAKQHQGIVVAAGGDGTINAVALIAAVITLFRERWQVVLRIENDGEETLLHTSTLFVGNNYLQLQKVGISEAESLQNRRLVALSVKPVGSWRMVNLVLRGAIGRLGAAENVNSFSFRHLEVQPFSGKGKKTTIKVATDGETFWLQTPLRFRVAPKPLWLVRPATDTGPDIG